MIRELRVRSGVSVAVTPPARQNEVTGSYRGLQVQWADKNRGTDS